eukprot:6880169-Alexandrium_andersonii.AAC.2
MARVARSGALDNAEQPQKTSLEAPHSSGGSIEVAYPPRPKLAFHSFRTGPLSPSVPVGAPPKAGFPSHRTLTIGPRRYDLAGSGH